MTSIYNKVSGLEHLWQADPNIWPWHAPNLFPVVGGLIDNELLVDGKTYPMKRHGFNRESELLLIESNEISARFSLPYSDHTLEVYPYKFDFQVHYELIENALRVTYKVINKQRTLFIFRSAGTPHLMCRFIPVKITKIITWSLSRKKSWRNICYPPKVISPGKLNL